jgi:hypothetical protein
LTIPNWRGAVNSVGCKLSGWCGVAVGLHSGEPVATISELGQSLDQRSPLMDRPPADDRSALSLAWAWATRIIAVAATVVVPPLIGVWIGQKFGAVWTIVLLLVGFALGATGAVLQLVQIAKDSKTFRSGESSEKPSDRTPGNR